MFNYFKDIFSKLYKTWSIISEKIYVNQIVITTRAYDAIAPDPLIIEQTNEQHTSQIIDTDNIALLFRHYFQSCYESPLFVPYYNGRHGFPYTHTCGLTFASVRKAVWSIVCIISIALKNN